MDAKINIVIPMAGEGKRFEEKGFVQPKPLIEVEGQPMFTYAVNSLNIFLPIANLIFIVQQKHELAFNITHCIKEKFQKAKVLILPKLTSGPVETVLQCSQLLMKQLPLIIMDCDFRFTSKKYFERVNNVVNHQENFDAVLLTFTATSNRYSYISVLNDKVIDIKEKTVISNKAIAGSYFFSSSTNFLRFAENILNHNSQKEVYISHVIYEMLKSGNKITWEMTDDYQSFGTPEELENRFQ